MNAPAGEAQTPAYQAQICVPADHPALAGHFPGAPLVPGVVILDAVLDAVEAWLGKPVVLRAIPQVKFFAPLPPGAPARALLEREGGRLRFKLEHNGRLLAQGVLTLAASEAES